MIKKNVKKRIKKIVNPLEEIDEKLKEKVIQEEKKIEKISKDAKSRALEFEKEARKTIATAIAAAFSFIIALFWRDAVEDLINKILSHFGLTNETYIAKILAAILVTIIGVIAIMRISKWGQLENK